MGKRRAAWSLSDRKAMQTQKEVSAMATTRVADSKHATIDVRRGSERLHTRAGWLDSHHSFSFGGYYDTSNTHHGLLLVSNDDVVKPGMGFLTHPHRDMEIVTWVLDGELEHKDSEGHKGLLYPGLAQRMTAGTGIWHSEMNPREDKEVHFVQMWVHRTRSISLRATSNSTSTGSWSEVA